MARAQAHVVVADFLGADMMNAVVDHISFDRANPPERV